MKHKLMMLSLALATWLAPQLSAQAGEVLNRVKDTQTLRVCVWPGYYGVTYRNPMNEQLGGIDIELSAQFAKDLNVKLQYVDTSFPQVAEDLKADKCDIAMFAIGVLPEREKLMKFSQPYLKSDIFGVTLRSSLSINDWLDIDKPKVRVAVQAGTFMEPVMKAALTQAELVIIKPPATREQELAARRIDVFMTDYPYSRKLVNTLDSVKIVAPPTPFFELPYAYATKPGDEDWLIRINEFVRSIKKDGRLEAAARNNGLSAIVVKR